MAIKTPDNQRKKVRLRRILVPGARDSLVGDRDGCAVGIGGSLACGFENRDAK
jgi:hypothetical protein